MTTTDGQNGHTALILTARQPELGRVKTRLAADIGAPAALAFYAACLERALSSVRAVDRDVLRVLSLADVTDAESARRLAGPGVIIHAQPPEDLGRRLIDAVRFAAARGASRFVLIASDTPDLDATHLEAAVDALATSDAALGPADDGGYWGFGFRSLEPSLFLDMPWSGPDVAADTRRRVGALGWSLTALPTLPDIDRGPELAAWLASAGDHPVAHVIRAAHKA